MEPFPRRNLPGLALAQRLVGTPGKYRASLIGQAVCGALVIVALALAARQVLGYFPISLLVPVGIVMAAPIAYLHALRGLLVEFQRLRGEDSAVRQRSIGRTPADSG